MSSKTSATSMGHITIRSFCGTDEHNVKQIFRAGMKEHVWFMYKSNLRNALYWLITIAALSVTCIYQSYIVLLFTATVFLLVPYLMSVHVLNVYVSQRLSGDLRDIKTYYMDKPRNHCWVAEYDGKVVGTVCVREDDEDCNRAELLTMSVAKDYRKAGIASKLTDTVVEFSTKNGYTELFLSTGDFFLPAQQLYQRKGFKLDKEYTYMNILIFQISVRYYSISLKV